MSTENTPYSRQREKRRKSIEEDITEPGSFRTLPQSGDAEQGVLASALLAPRNVLDLLQRKGVSPEWFAVPAHRIIFDALNEMSLAGAPIDFLTLTQYLKDKRDPGGLPLLDMAGGASFVTSLFTLVPSAANAGYYLDIVREKYYLREVIEVSTSLASRAYQEDNPEELRQEADSLLARIADPEAKGKRSRSIHDIVAGVTAKVAAGKTEEAWGISTGFPNLDAVARGMRGGNMISIGGETGAGKTSLALNIAYYMAVKRGLKVLIFSLEMSEEEVVEVLIQIGSGVNIDCVREGRVNDGELRRYAHACQAIANAPFVIRDEKDVSIIQARSIARRERPRLIVGDYAQLFSGGKRRYERADLEVADVSRNFKKMCGELDATGFLITQLNDDGKVSGSRAIAKDSDQMWIVEETGEDTRNVKICKQRRGKKDVVPFRFIGPAQKFLPLAI